MFKISIIIPVYNMEQYLGECLNSVIKQTIIEKEIIVIDDGSTDNSLKIINEFQEKYKNVKLIKENHQGAGNARNKGIEVSRGEYICFLDADDFYWTDFALEDLYIKAKQNEAVICGGRSCDYVEGHISAKGLRKERIVGNDEYIYKEDYPGMTGYCSCIFLRQFINNFKIKFPSFTRGEDAIFFIEAISKAGKVYRTKTEVYVYRRNHKSVVYSEEKSIDQLRAQLKVLKIAKKNQMINVIKVVAVGMECDLGALLYKYVSENSIEMIKILNEYVDEFADTEYRGIVSNSVSEICKYVDDKKEKKTAILKEWKEKELYIYGAGNVGNALGKFLHANGISIKGYVLTQKGKNEHTIYGMDLFSVEEIKNINNSKVLIIIAAYPYNQKEMKMTLRECGIENFYALDVRSFYLMQQNIEIQ